MKSSFIFEIPKASFVPGVPGIRLGILYYFFSNISLIFNIITPATIMQIETIFKILYGSLKYIMPMIDTPIIPSPAQIAYAKLKSNFFKAKRKTVNPIAQKRNVKIEGYNFVKPLDSFMHVEPDSSARIPINNSNHFILFYTFLKEAKTPSALRACLASGRVIRSFLCETL